jgi:hypothetical protein
MSNEQLDAAVHRICRQAALPRDEELRCLQADLIDHWLRRHRALGRTSELDERELLALAVELRVGDLHALAGMR